MPAAKRIGSVSPHRARLPGRFHLHVEAGELRVGDTIRIRGLGFEVEDRIELLEVDGHEVENVRPGDDVDVTLAHGELESGEVFVLRDKESLEMEKRLSGFDHLDRIPPMVGLDDDPGEDRIRVE